MVCSVSGKTCRLHLKLSWYHAQGNDFKLEFPGHFHHLALWSSCAHLLHMLQRGPRGKLQQRSSLPGQPLQRPSTQTVPDHSLHPTSSPHSPHKAPPQSCTMLSLLAQRMVPPGQAHGLSSLGHAGFRRRLCASVYGWSRGRAEHSSGRPLATAVYVRALQVG